ncbi:hypothetical protein MCOR25_011187 [Pyricularia grisea]|uniref:Uncharacterized protein n=1 Tax=Pyricularia grisea TaxID=148305 RepID=A0A6P8B7K8_PYRGI|nr:hypothetical protein PgNI_05289 [Pyricularia grisea]KAI6342248.1 hypothetical protein MCOR25_011187 [Pyricularia grisea]TLD11311.1 hypothetical protein PgNI_05289 [Pyricularia grisea]
MSSSSAQYDAAGRNEDLASPMISPEEEAPSTVFMPFGERERVNIVGLFNTMTEGVNKQTGPVELPCNDVYTRRAARAFKRILREGDGEKKLIALKFLQHIQDHKTVEEQVRAEAEETKRDKFLARAARRCDEVLFFMDSLTTEIRSLTDTPLDASFNFADLEYEVERFRRFARKTFPPSFLRGFETPMLYRLYAASLVISFDKAFFLSLANVPNPPDEPERYASSKVASPHIYRATWAQMNTRSPVPSEQPAKVGSSKSKDVVYIKHEEMSEATNPHLSSSPTTRKKQAQQMDHNPEQTDKSDLPRIVLEIGHLAIVHMASTRDRYEAPMTATGLGLFVDLCDRRKGLWLLRTDDYIGVKLDEQSAPSPGLQEFLKLVNLDQSCGNRKLSEHWGLWSSMGGLMQIEILKGTGDTVSLQRHLVPKFETFHTSPA